MADLGVMETGPRAAKMQVNELLLAALARSFRNWTGQPALLVDVEGHGREELFETVDLSRTVGWFTAFCPALLELSATADVGEDLLQIKQQVRGMPSKRDRLRLAQIPVRRHQY